MRFLKAVLVGLFVVTLAIPLLTRAQRSALPSGEYDLEEGQYVFNVPGGATATPTDTSTPEPTATDTLAPTDTPTPTNTPEPDSAWHPPTDHEHGDPPPQWVLDSPMQPDFDKGELHQGFKGFRAVPGDYSCCNGAEDLNVEIYFLAHIISTPKARATLFHSYQLWLLDEPGNVSYWQGMLFSNYLGIGSCLDRAGADLIAVTQEDLDAGCHPNEAWYFHANRGSVDGLWSIGRVNYLHDPDDDLTDPATWNPGPEPNTGLRRGIHIAMYKQRILDQGGVFDQVFCVGNQTPTNLGGEILDCSDANGLPQFVASTIPDGSGSLGATEWRVDERIYSCPECEVPN